MKEQVQKSIIRALRKEFDEKGTSHLRLKEILETVKQLGFVDTWEEMRSDLIGEGVIKDDSWYVPNDKVFLD